jgi:hypothetical protein
MAGKDPFLISGRWKLLAAPLALGAAALLVMLMGVVEPLDARASRDDLRATIISDSYRIEHAVLAYLADNGALPSAAFDLSEGHDGGLVLRAAAPLAHQATWKGPYLVTPPAHPLPRCFWSLAEPQLMQDDDGDGQADEAWSRLHRGYGELDDETAAWLDQTLDDGRPDAGGVRVTPTWIWFKITER